MSNNIRNNSLLLLHAILGYGGSEIFMNILALLWKFQFVYIFQICIYD